MWKASVRSFNAQKELTKRTFLKRFYSAGHHEEPLAPPENMLNSFLVTPVIMIAGVLGAYAIEKRYERSHNGETLVAKLGNEVSFDKLTNSFKSYQEVVTSERKLAEMMNFTPKYDKDFYPLYIDGVPGRYFPYNAASNFSVNVDFENLEERRSGVFPSKK